ncbi:hypothetical protein I4U23_021659 [Adineta vaga]|nr:hypothetical protein I4U23_021659 [Adineta vaga]
MEQEILRNLPNVVGSKRYRNRKTKRIRVDAPVEQASDESTCQSDSIQTDQPPIQSDVVTADLSQHHLIEQVPGESIEEAFFHTHKPIFTIFSLCIEQSLDEIHLPEPSVKTVVPINVQDQFNENEDNEENVDENEPLSILEIRQNNKNILEEWDEKVTRIEEEISRVYKQTKIQIRNLTLETNKQVRNLKNQVNVVVAERAKVEEELSIRLQEKILDWKLKKSDKTRKKTKRPGTKKIFRR